MTAAQLLRADLRVLADLIRNGSRVLDVGCGDGRLLEYLRDERGCDVSGIEISIDGVTECVRRGIPVLHADLERGLADLPNGAFDFVIVSQTLQEVRNIRQLVREVRRVGKQAVISYPNFAPLAARLRLGLKGRMPISETLPYQWYDTPNVHYTTIRDFRTLCDDAGLIIERELWFRLKDGRVKPVRVAPNLRAELAVAVISSENR